ncbi:MAG: peptidylprolyl isomerase [Cyanobacteria bacterium P01_A01_bin.114]
MSIQPEDIIDILRQDFKLRSLCEQILFQELVRSAAAEHDIAITSVEIQAKADQMRLDYKLESASKTFEWLRHQLIASDDWESGIKHRLLSQKLADCLFSEDVEKQFTQSRLDFEQANLYRIVVPYSQVAQELYYQIEENEISFYEAAHLYDIDERRRLQCGFEGRLSRWQLAPEIAAAVFGASVRTVVGPLKTETGHELLWVDEFIEPELSTEIYEQIRDRMFQTWLERELQRLEANQTA